jgi:hypothetical protein
MGVFNLFCQENLIVNGNCDSLIGCPEYAGQIDSCYGWTNYSTFNSADYLNTCSSNSFSDIPSQIGYQLPHSGNGYIHIIPISLKPSFTFNGFYNSVDNIYTQYRESVIGTFKYPLENKRYYFECYTTLANYIDISNNGNIAINGFDIKLLNNIDHPIVSTSPYIDITDIKGLNANDSIINDTTNWVKLSTCFVANGGEKYFAFGCFRDSLNIQYTTTGDPFIANAYYSWYFFDSFSLIQCDTCCDFTPPIIPIEEGLEIANSASSSNKPIVFTANISENSYAKMEIYDSRGRIVERHTFTTDDNLYTPSMNLEKALYHYRFETENGLYQSGKFIIVE